MEHFEGIQELEAQVADVYVAQLLLVLAVEVQGHRVPLLFDNVKARVVRVKGLQRLSRALKDELPSGIPDYFERSLVSFAECTHGNDSRELA